MRWLVVLLMIILTLPFAMGQTLDYDFFVDNAELISVDSGLLYLYAPNQTLEKTNILMGAMFFPKTGFEGDLTLNQNGEELEKDFFVLDDAPGNESYLIFEWNIYALEDAELTFLINSLEKVIYEKKLYLSVKERKLINRTFVQKTIPLTFEIPENLTDLRIKLSEKGFDITQKEFEKMQDSASYLEVAKKVNKEILTYEGELIITKTKTTFNLGNLNNNEIYIIENIDKSIAENTSEINFQIPPIILEEDPLIMWHIEDSNIQEISYEIEKQGVVDEELTGNTILLSNSIDKQDKNDIKKILLPLIIIPVIVAIVIYFGTVNVRKKK